MNTKLILIIISYLFLVSCSEKKIQVEPQLKNDLNKLNLKGSIKTISADRYVTSVSDSNEVIIGSLILGSPEDNMIFNEKGFITTTTCRYDTTVNQTVIFKYDNKNRLVKKAQYFYDGSMHGFTMYHYDNMNKLIQEDWCTSETNIQSSIEYYYYDRVIKKVKYQKEELKHKYLSLLDCKGRLIESYSIHSKNKNGQHFFYKYNTTNQIIYDELHNTQDSVSYITSMVYDELGNITSNECVSSDGNFIGAAKYDYITDSIGNWIERIEYINRGTGFIPVEKTIRKIEYYN